MTTHSLTLPRLGAVMALVLAGGCANMNDVAPGESADSLYTRFGTPHVTCPLATGGQRVVWTQQPMGQYAWGGNIGPDGRIDALVPLLTDTHFAVLAQGDWTPERLRCEFGPPAFIDQVGMPSVRQVVWNYRYREASSWNSLMYVYMGPNGDRVTRFHPGPDPMYEERDGNFGW